MLLDQSLAASINIIPAIHSLYTWESKRFSVDEVLLLVKTQVALFERLVKVVRGLHPYQVPCIIGLPILVGNDDYLEWIDRAVSPALEP